METKLIESLIADDVLGHLSEHSSQLLNEYIEGNSDYIKIRESFDYLNKGFNEMSASDTIDTLPEFPVSKIKQQTCDSSRTNSRSLLRIAAIIFLPLMLLVSVALWTSTPDLVRQTTASVATAQQNKTLINKNDIPSLIPSEKFFNSGRKIKSKSDIFDNVIKKYKIRGMLL